MKQGKTNQINQSRHFMYVFRQRRKSLVCSMGYYGRMQSEVIARLVSSEPHLYLALKGGKSGTFPYSCGYCVP